MKYHTQLLTLSDDHAGSWTLTQLGSAEQRMGIDQEIAALEEKLTEVKQWESRVEELNALLRAKTSQSDEHDLDGEFEAVEGPVE